MGASRRRLPLSLILILLTALIAGALGQQEECDILGKSEAVDEAEPHRHAGARTCPGRSVGRAAGVSGRAQGCAGVYPSGANPDQPADRAPAPARAREDSIRLDFCKQKSVNKVRVEIGTQAGALVFHIAMEDVFMWSRKARQFLNKCRDFMAVTDDVRPAGLPRPAEAMDMLFDAYRDENGVNRCERISSGKRCIIDESMTLHQSLEVALWAEPECSRGMEMKRKICECSCWSSIVDVYGPMLEQWGGYDGQVAIKKQELEDLCKQGLVSDFNGEFRESSSTQCGSNEITVEITPQTDGGLPAGTFFTIAGLNGEPHGSMQLNAISSSFLGQLKWDPASCSQWCSKSGMCPSSGNAKDSSCLSRPIAESDAADTVEGASGAITTSEAITSNRCVRWCDKDGKLTVKVLRSMPSNTKVVISVTMLNPTFSQASRPLVVSASGSGFYLKPRAIEAFSGAKSVLTAADMPMFTTFEINEDPCNGVFDPKSRVWRGSCAGMVNTLRFTVNPNLEPHGGSQILIRGLVRSDSAKLSPPTLRDMDGTLNGLSIDQWDSSTGTLTLRVTAGDGASQDPVVPVGNTSKFALDFEMPSSADDAPLPSDKGKKITVEVLRAGPQLNCQFHTAEYYFPNLLRSKVPDEKWFETRKVGTSTCSPGECNTISVTFASNRLIREASDEVILVITGLKGMDNSLVCNPSTSCGDPDVNSIPLSDVKSGSNDKNLFQSLSKNTGLATWNAAVGSLAMNLAPGAELHPYKNYAVSFKLKNGYEKTVLNDIRISAYLKGACMRSSASSSSSAVSPVASKYSTSALAPCAGEQMEQTQSGGVVVCNPAFTVKTIGQTYPWPGCDGASNYIQVTLVPNVKIEYPAVIHLLHFIGPSDVEVFPTVNVSGVVSVSKNATIRYGVTHADKNSSNTSFLWSDSSDKVTLPLWAGYPLIAGDEYVFAFGVRNPKATKFVGSQAPISIQVRGPIFNISMPLDHNLTAVPIENRTFPGDAAALRVNAPAFVQKIIGQSNPYPDALNTLTVTLVPNIAMGTESPNNSSHLTSKITLSGLISTETHSSTLAITQSSPSSSVLNSNATWSRQDGKLVVSFKNFTKWRTSDAPIIFSFQIKNPGICQSSPDVMVSDTSEGTNCPRKIQVASMDKDAVIVPFSTCRACGAVGDHCNACDKCDQLCDDADASSLKVHSPAFIIKEVQQETTWPGAENKFNVSFAANIDLTGHSSIFLSGFVGGTAPNRTLNLTAGASLFDPVEWHKGDKVLYLNVASAGITAGTTNKLTNPLQAQRAPLIMIWALNAGSCLKPVPKCTMDRPTTTSLQPLTVDPKFFTARAIGQSSPLTSTQNTITATLATNFALKRPTKVTLKGLMGSTIEDNLALKVTTVAGGNLFETTGIWTRGTGTLVLSLIESASSVPGQNYTISIDLMNPPAAQNNPLVSVTANDVDAVQTRSWPNANLPACDQLPMKVIKPRIVTAKISQSSAFPGARNVITVTLRMNAFIPSTSKGSFTITGLMGAQRRTGPIALQSPASCNGTATVLTALPSGTSCMNIFKSSPTGTGWWQGHSNQGEDAQEGSMPQSLVLFVANGINANVDYVFSFDVQNPTCNHECSTVSIIANGLDFVHANCGGEINSFIASPVASKTAIMQDMSTSTSCAGLVHAPNFNVKTITECSTVNGDPNAITVILSPNVDLKQGSILSIFGLTGSNTDAPTLEIEGPDSTLFSEVMWSKREGELKMKIRDVSGISMGQTVVFSFSLQNPSNQVTPKEPTVGVESANVIIGDSVMSGLVLGAGDRPFFNLASISESTSVQRTYNTLMILINSNSRIPTSSKITLTGLKGTLPMTESGQIAGMHPFYFGSNPLWNHASGTLALEVSSMNIPLRSGAPADLSHIGRQRGQAQRWTMTLLFVPLLFVLVLAVAAIGAATTFSQASGLSQSHARGLLEDCRSRLLGSMSIARAHDGLPWRRTLRGLLALSLLSAMTTQASEVRPDDTSWKSHVEAASAGTIVRFHPGVYHGECNVAVPPSVTLATASPSSAVIIDCKSSGRHFLVADGIRGVSFVGLSLVNGLTDDDGGCVLMGQDASLAVHNVSFRNCSAGRRGGAVFVGHRGRLVATNSHISRCNAQHQGGGMFFDELSQVEMSQVAFRSVSSGTCLQPQVQCVSNVWTNSMGFGCAAYATNPSWCGWEESVENCCACGGGMSQQSCEKEGDGGGCFAARHSSIDLVSVEFRNCSTAVAAGALFLDQNATGTIDDTQFLHCAAQDGGALELNGNVSLDLTRVSLRYNDASRVGGAISAKLGGNRIRMLEGTHVTDNTAGRGGGAYMFQSTLIVDASVIESNVAESGGGGMFVRYSSITLRAGSSVSHNSVLGGNGGGLQLLGTWLSLDHSSIAYNLAVWGGGLSGPALCPDGIEASLAHSHCQLLPSSIVLSNGSTVNHNFASQYGGGFGLRGGFKVTSTQSSIEDNFAGATGGGVSAIGCVLDLRDGTSVRRNTAVYMGGGFYLDSSSLMCAGSVINSNTAGLGGGIFGTAGTSVVLSASTTVAHNFAMVVDSSPGNFNGAGVFVSVISLLICADSSIFGNSASGLGGGVAAYIYSSATILNSSVSENFAMTYGAGVWVGEDSQVSSLNSTFKDNVAYNGAGMTAYVRSSILLGDGTSVARNLALNLGGGCVCQSATLETDGVVNISGNTAQREGGAIWAAGSRVMMRAGYLTLDNNIAGSLGGACVLDESSSLLENQAGSSVQQTIAMSSNTVIDGNGGGLAVRGGSTITLKFVSVIVSHNTAAKRGGGVFIDFMQAQQREALSGECMVSTSKHAFGHLQLVGNTAQTGEGGGLFSFSNVDLMSGGHTNAMNNTAVRGGAVALSDAELVIQDGHILIARGNLAKTDGGAFALLSGAKVSLLTTTGCTPECTSSWIGDSLCASSCMSKECNWDAGDCQSRIDAAGTEATQACNRDTCAIWPQTSAPTTWDCATTCLSASCDWSREECAEQRSNVRSCPLIDAAAFTSIRMAQQQTSSPKLASPMFMNGGNSQNGFGRCSSPCHQPTQPPQASSMQAAGAVGLGALSLLQRANDPDRGGWLHALMALPPEATVGFTVECWVRIPSACGQVEPLQFVISSADYAIAIHETGEGKFVPLFFWVSPPRQQCSAELQVFTNITGVISDGPGMLHVGQICSWILAPGGSVGGYQHVTLFFSQFMFTNFDRLELSSCLDITCQETLSTTTFLGSFVPPPWTSATPVALVKFQNSATVGNSVAPGFTATYAGTPTPDAFPALKAGEWNHIALTVSGSGLSSMFVNGTQSNCIGCESQLPLGDLPAQSPLVAGDFASGIGHGAPDWQNGGDFGNAECLELDELRLWAAPRTPSDISLNVYTGCGDLSDPNKWLAACYSFDETSASDEGLEGLKDYFPDSSPNAIPAFVARHGSPYLPWCLNIDDEGALKLDSSLGAELPQMWGYCTIKPRLPGAGFDYIETTMEVAARHRAEAILLRDASVLRYYPGCADVPMILEYNAAEMLGGAFYYDSCVRLDKMCFLQGVDIMSSSKAVLLSNNQAGVGGAIYVKCQDIGTQCSQVFGDANVIGALPALNKVDFTDSTATIYGDRIATKAASLHWHGISNRSIVMLTPGQEPLSLIVKLFDSQGNVVRGSDDAIELLICPVISSEDECTFASSSVPPINKGFDPLTGLSNIEAAVECGVSSSASAQERAGSMHTIVNTEMVFQLRVIGAEYIPKLSGRIHCNQCQTGQKKILNQVTGTWYCQQCQTGTYILNPNIDLYCQPCPIGATCMNGRPPIFHAVKVSAEIGMEVSVESNDGRSKLALAMRLGIEASRIGLLPQQRRVEKFVRFEVIEEHVKEAGLVASLRNKGAVVTGTTEVGRKLPDGETWEEVDGVYLLRQCSPGSLLVNSSVELQQCRPCPANSYLLEGSTACAKCPVGAECTVDLNCTHCLEGTNFLPHIPNSKWDRDTSALDGTYTFRLSSCPSGFLIERTEVNPQGDYCRRCLPNTYSIEETKWSDLQTQNVTCIYCPIGMQCFGGNNVTPQAEFWANPHQVLINFQNVSMYDSQLLRKSAHHGTGALDLRAYRCNPRFCLPNWECRKGHHGRLCGLCNNTPVDSKYYAMGSHGCVQCSGTDTYVIWSWIVVLSIFAALLYYLAVWRAWIQFENIEVIIDRVVTAYRDGSKSIADCVSLRNFGAVRTNIKKEFNALGYLKVVVSFCQVTATFLTNLDVHWPPFLSTVMAGFSIFNFVVFRLPFTACAFSELTHFSRLVTSTIFPLVVMALLALPTALRSFSRSVAQLQAFDETGQDVLASFFFSTLSFLFLVYPMVSTITLGTFSCIYIDGTTWLRSDLLEPCPRDTNAASFMYGILFTILFPAGIPLMFLLILYYFKVPRLARQKVKMNLLRAVLIEIGMLESFNGRFEHWDWEDEPVNLLTRSECSLILQNVFRLQQVDEDDPNEAIFSRLSSLNGSTQEGENTAVQMPESAFDADDCPLDDLRARTAGHIEMLCRDEVVVVPTVVWDGKAGEVERLAISRAGFLFIMYRCQCWWYEIFEMIRKLVLSAVILFFGSPWSQFAFGFFISFSYVVFQLLCKPHVSAGLQLLQSFAVFTQTLILAYGLVLIAIQGSGDVGSTTSSGLLDVLDICMTCLTLLVFLFPFIRTLLLEIYMRFNANDRTSNYKADTHGSQQTAAADTGGASIREVGTDLTVEGRIAASGDEVGTSVRIDKFTGELSNSEVVFHHPLTQAVPETTSSQAATYARESPHQSTIHFGALLGLQNARFWGEDDQFVQSGPLPQPHEIDRHI